MTFLVETLKGRARLRLKQSLVTHETGNGLKSGRRTGVAPLGRRCRANAGMRKRPGQTENTSAAAIARFVEEHEITVLNVAGPRLSKWACVYSAFHASPLADADAVREEGAGAAGWNGEGG